jgi:tetratricopeptide (TPR) repeat protein
MASLIDRIRLIFQELRRRKVVRVGLVFGGVTLAILSVFDDILRSVFPLVDAIYPYLVIAGIVAFPVVLVLAWAFELTADGVRLTTPADGHEPSLVTRVGAVVVVGVVSIGFGWVLAGGLGPGPIPLEEPPPLTSVAVLYLDDHSAGGTICHIADQLTEELTRELAAVGLEVKGRAQMKELRDSDADVRRFMTEIGAGSYLEGSIAGMPEDLVITLQHIDANTGNHISQMREAHFAALDLGSVNSISTSLIMMVRDSLARHVRDLEAQSSTESVDALSFLKRAWVEMDASEQISREDPEAALAFIPRVDQSLEMAQQLDTAWALPVIERGWLALLAGGLSGDRLGIPTEQSALRAIQLADEALARTPENPKALELRGVARFHLGEIDDEEHSSYLASAEADLREAQRLDPTRARAVYALSRIYLMKPELRVARRYAERALRSGPFVPNREQIIHTLFEVNGDLESFAEANQWCDRGRREYPESWDFWICRVFSVANFPNRLASIEEAQMAIDSFRVFAGDDLWAQSLRQWADQQLSILLARHAQAEDALAVLERLRADGYEIDPYDEARMMCVLEDRERTLELLAIHLENEPSKKEQVRNDWWWESLRDDPRFLELTEG